MRRFITTLLAATMLLALLCPAMAWEDADIFKDEAGQVIPMYQWSEEQWQQAAGWNGEQAYAYFEWVYSLYDLYDYDYELVYAYYEALVTLMEGEQWTEEMQETYMYLQEVYYAQYEENYRRESLKRMGLPYEDGINIAFNGKFMTFEGTRAVIIDGVTMIPVKALAKVLEAEYSENDGIAVIARNGVTATVDGQGRALSVGGAQVETTLTPYIQDGEVMAPLRALSAVFGCEVQWDSYYNIVFVVDRFALVNSINQEFTIANELLAAITSFSAEDGKTRLSLKAEATAYGENENYAAAFGITGEEIRRDGVTRGDYALELNLELIKLILPYYYSYYYYYYYDTEEILAQIDQAEKLVDGSKISYIYDDKGDFYLKTAMLDEFLPMLKDKWLHIPDIFNELFGTTSLEVDYSRLTVGDLVYDIIWPSYMYSYYYTSEYYSADYQVEVLKNAFGDQAFTKLPGGGYSYKLQYDGLSEVVELEVSFKLHNGQLESIDGSLDIKSESFPGTTRMEFRMDAKGSYALLEVKGLIIGKLVVEMETVFTPGKYDITLPAEKDIVDIYDTY